MAYNYKAYLCNPALCVRVFILIFILSFGTLSYKVYQQVIFVRYQRRQLIQDFSEPDVENSTRHGIIEKKTSEKRKLVSKILRIKAFIKTNNVAQEINNQHLLKMRRGVPMFLHMIIVQVHSNVYLLKELLKSLKQSYQISRTLIIFSHDYYEFKINTVIKEIDFAPYIQIFFPYTTQLHPTMFPGTRTCDDAMICNINLKRDPVLAQLKHHWWWTMNQVFDNMDITKNFEHPIIVLEGNNIVTTDFLVVKGILEGVKILKSPDCELISLGAYVPDYDRHEKKKPVVKIEGWSRKLKNIGIGFDRYIWQTIKLWAREFCYFNDFTWANSLKYLAVKNKSRSFTMTNINTPKVFRLDQCEGENIPMCDEKSLVSDVLHFINSTQSVIFLNNITIEEIVNTERPIVKPLGFFNDNRDHELCMYISSHNVWY